MDCGFVAKAGIEEEILKKDSEYANRVHKMKDIQKEVLVIIISYH